MDKGAVQGTFTLNPTFATMAKILNIETSTTVCSIAIGIDGKIVSVNEINDGYSHAEKIEELIQKSLGDAKITLQDLDAVSVSKGPGSYTGLRIGVSIAKGLCFGLNTPLISVPTLEAMAMSPLLLNNRNEYKVPMLDARRMEVYACVLGANNALISPTSAIVIDESSFSETLQNSTVFFGPGMDKCKPILTQNPNANFVENVLPSAAQMVSISDTNFAKMDFEDVAYFEPYYLKNFIAGKPKKLL